MVAKKVVKRGWLAALLAMNLMAGNMAFGQEPAPAAPAYTGLKQLQPDDSNLFVMGDILPHIRRMLSSPALQTMVKEGRLGKAIQESTGQPADVAQWLKMIEDQSQHIPTEILMATPDSSFTQLGHVATLGLQFSLATAIKNDGGDAVKDLPRLQKEMLAELTQTKMPRMTFWINFRTPGDSRVAMGLIRVQAGQMQESMPPDALKVGPRQVTLKLKVGDRMDDATLGGALMQLGIVDDMESPTCKAIIAAAQKLSVFVSVDMVENGIKLTIAPDELPAGAGVDKAALGTLWKPDASTILFTNSNLGAWGQALAEVQKNWDAWSGTPAGKRVVEMDKGNLLGTLAQSLEQMKQAGTHMALRIWADDALHMEALDDNKVPMVPVANAPWITMIPAGADIVTMEGGPSLVNGVASMVEQVDQAMSRAANDPQMAGVREKIDTYFKGFRASLLKMPGVFGPTSAMVGTSNGMLKKLSISGQKDGKPQAITVENVKVLEFATFGVAKNGDEASALIREAANQLVKGIINAADKDVANPSALHEEDLGLGVKTWVFDTDWLTEMAKPEEIKITIEGDMRPHFFVVNNVVVMSTSPRLSKEIIAAGKAGKKYPLPAGPVVAYSHMGNKVMVNGFVMVADMIREVHKSMAANGMPGMEAADTEKAINVILGLAELATMFNDANGVTTREGNVNHSTGVVTFGAGHLIK